MEYEQALGSVRRLRTPWREPAVIRIMNVSVNRDAPPRNGAAAAHIGQKKRVLLVSLYHPELVRGGGQLCCYELFQGLKEHPDLEPYFLAGNDQSYPALFKPG